MSEQILSVAAISGDAKQIMLLDGTILAIRAFFDSSGRETDDFDTCHSFLVVDHRTQPSTLISIETAAIEYSGQA